MRRYAMPVLSMFYGIIIRMYSENSERYNLPHFHAYYAEYEAVINLEGEIIEGEFPKNKLSLVKAWVDIHKDELAADWELLKNGDQFFKINPLI
jgi:hypothetical protein